MKQNPKYVQAQKDGKVPMDLLPWKPLAAVARVMATGAGKYGIRNWLVDEILASTYVAAIGRHTFLEWAQGINEDKDSGEHPLAHVVACCLIVMNAEDNNKLIDDRLRKESKLQEVVVKCQPSECDPDCSGGRGTAELLDPLGED